MLIENNGDSSLTHGNAIISITHYKLNPIHFNTDRDDISLI